MYCWFTGGCCRSTFLRFSLVPHLLSMPVSTSTATPATIELLPTLAAARLRWAKTVDASLQRSTTTTFTRTVGKGTRAGTEETVTRRGARRIVDGAATTGYMLVKMYYKRLEQVVAAPFLFDILVTDTGMMLPSILVDSRMLGQQRGLCARTIRNHIRQLMEAEVGLIVRKKWHGRKRQYELWINPKVVLLQPENRVENPVEPAAEVPTIGQIMSVNSKNFPPIEPPEVLKDQKLDIGQSGKVLSDDFSKKPFPEAEVCRALEADAQASKQGTGGRGAAPATQIPPAAEDPATAARTARNEAYVVSCWLLAKALLYRHLHFSPYQETLALTAIRRGVYRDFEDSTFDFERYHRGVLRRLELVEKYLQKHAGDPEPKYVPAPWAEIVHGKGYFDWGNLNGFRGTMSWLIEDERLEKRRRANRAVDKAVSELKLRRKLDRGEKTTRRPAQHVQAASFTTLYQGHCRRIEQLGGQPALDKFNQQVQNLLR